MMSDLHIGEVIGKDLVQKYVKLSNEQHPDMVVLVGDIMDYESRFAENAHIEEDLRQLKAPLGVYIVTGIMNTGQTGMRNIVGCKRPEVRY